MKTKVSFIVKETGSQLDGEEDAKDLVFSAGQSRHTYAPCQPEKRVHAGV